jgi:hypothetical protein
LHQCPQGCYPALCCLVQRLCLAHLKTAMQATDWCSSMIHT